MKVTNAKINDAAQMIAVIRNKRFDEPVLGAAAFCCPVSAWLSSVAAWAWVALGACP
ncbi:MAG: hypothetical protein HXP06_07135 [Trueperella pyogenes]|nr:hypothetical protein [Trueperella pyogenes]